MTTLTDQQLLRDYAENGSEPAFSELVRRHVDLVYSAALRMVRDTHLAEDVTQGVFAALAKKAAQLTGHPVLSGWLHRTASNLAAQTVRTEVRRRNREQEAVAMNELLSAEPEAVWDYIEPALDAALSELNEPDRDALLLRYFERKSAAEMAQTLGISDEAAQKRVNRAVDRLRELFASRGIAVGASGLVVVMSAHGVQAAPAGLALSATTAALAGTAAVTSVTATATTAIVMTAIQKTIIAATLAVAVGAGIYATRQASNLNAKDELLRQRQAEQTALQARVDQLQRERDEANNRVAALAAEKTSSNKSPSEVLKLRGEVGQLRQENTSIKSTSPLNKITGDPASRKMLRDQQKMAMSGIYKDLAKKLKLTPDQTDKLNDLLADNIMDNVDRVTEVLHDGTTGAALDQVFDGQDAALLQKIREIAGPDGVAQYQEYTRNLLGGLTVQQFSDQLTGDKAAKKEKNQQLLQAVQEETQAAISGAGLPADYQAVPMLNFRNIASETEGDQSLQLLQGILDRVAARASAFLTPAELDAFRKYESDAIAASRTALMMNRKMMAPISQ